MRRTLLLVLCASFIISGTFLTVTGKMGEAGGVVDDDSGNGNRLLGQDATLSQSVSATTQGAGIIPADRITTWNPGLNAIGGIPARTTLYQTRSPRGGSLADTAAIPRALDNC